jgi:hypothetical protein
MSVSYWEAWVERCERETERCERQAADWRNRGVYARQQLDTARNQGTLLEGAA